MLIYSYSSIQCFGTVWATQKAFGL